MAWSFVVVEPVEHRDKETVDKSHQQELILVLHHPQHRTQNGHFSLYFIEVVFLTLEVLVKLILILNEWLYLLVSVQTVDSNFELFLHVLSYLFGDRKMREVYFDDVTLEVDLYCSYLILEEDQSVVVGMEVVLHLLLQLFLLQHALLLFLSFSFFYCGEKFLDDSFLLLLLVYYLLVTF